MALNLSIANYKINVPWFMFDLYNKQLITTAVIPSDINDNKSIVITEIPVPGLNFQPIQVAGGGNRRISFTIPIIKRNNTVGNIMLVKQFENLRNQAVGLLGIFSSGQFTPNPKVLFYWGTGSIPLEYYVAKCDMVHKHGWVNAMGQPQYTEISVELILDENSLLYKAEEAYRKMMSVAGMVIGTTDVAGLGRKKPY